VTQKHDHDDTDISNFILLQTMRAIDRLGQPNREYDIPYVAGYSKDGKTIYIDKDVPDKYDRFLLVHERVEKALIDGLGLKYQYAHQIAFRTEDACVKSSNIDVAEYNKFWDRYIKLEREKINSVPKDLDLTPYEAENDNDLIAHMKTKMV
jgi:hypothetical protein